MISFSTRHLGALFSALLLGLVALVYIAQPQRDLAPLPSARLQNGPLYRVISDPADLLRYANATGPAAGVVLDTGTMRHGADAETAGEQSASAEPALQGAAGASDVPAGLAVAPLAAQSAQSTASIPDPAIEEFKDLGMATIVGGGDWYTLQTAYVSASDVDQLKLRILEVSAALGSRDGIFVYESRKADGVFYGLCVRRFDSGASAKAFKIRLDRKLAYPTQLRSKKGLQKELGF